MNNLNITTTVTLNNNLPMPIFGLGVYQAGAGKETEEAVLHALAFGYRHIDTAAIYGNEKNVGKAIVRSGLKRKDIFVTTKLWNDDHEDVEKAFHKSLKQLNLTYVDLYLMHYPVLQRVASYRIMEKLYAQGLCKAIGVSNFTKRHLTAFLQQTKIIPAVNQVEFSPYLHQKELLEYCNEKGIHLEAYSPLTRGKKLKDPKLVAIAQHYNKTPAQLLIRWCLQKNIIVIPKSTQPSRIEENATVFDFSITPEDMKTLDGLNENLRTCWDPTNAL